MGKSTGKLKFEEALRRLDEIVSAMEAGEIGIEESITQYEEAMRLAAHCRRILDAAELRVKQIQLDAEGRISTQPLPPVGEAPPGPGPSADADCEPEEPAA